MSEVTVGAFIQEEFERLEAFVADWKKSHQTHPNMFPLVMGEDNVGLWDEQLYAFDPAQSNAEAVAHLKDETQPMVVPAGQGLSLDDFAAQEKKRLEAFQTRWEQAQALNDALFPTALTLGDWGEQLLAFDPDHPFDLPTPRSRRTSRPA